MLHKYGHFRRRYIRVCSFIPIERPIEPYAFLSTAAAARASAEKEDGGGGERVICRVPLRRYGEPEEVAHATLSLVLPAASYINGAVLMVDGGLSIQNS